MKNKKNVGPRAKPDPLVEPAWPPGTTIRLRLPVNYYWPHISGRLLLSASYCPPATFACDVRLRLSACDCPPTTGRLFLAARADCLLLTVAQRPPTIIRLLPAAYY